MENPKIIMVDINDLIHPDYNPRKISDHDKKELTKSLETFDCVEPAVINANKERLNIIIGGNQRVKVAKSLGWLKFPCVAVDLGLKKERELNIRLNKNTGEWDWDILQNMFEIDDLIIAGFEKDEFDKNLTFDDPNDLKPDPNYSNDLDYTELTLSYHESDSVIVKSNIDKIIEEIPSLNYKED